MSSRAVSMSFIYCQTSVWKEEKPMKKILDDFQPEYCCTGEGLSFSPKHEIGCPHKEWTKEELQEALNSQKQSNEFLWHLLHETGFSTVDYYKDGEVGFGPLLDRKRVVRL